MKGNYAVLLLLLHNKIWKNQSKCGKIVIIPCKKSLNEQIYGHQIPPMSQLAECMAPSRTLSDLFPVKALAFGKLGRS